MEFFTTWDQEFEIAKESRCMKTHIPSMRFRLILLAVSVGILVLLMGIGTFIRKGADPPATDPMVTAPSQAPFDRFLSKITTKSDVKRELTTAHAHLNEITGWKHYEEMNLGQWANYTEYHFMQHALYDKMAEIVTDRDVQTDLRNVSKLIRYAKENDRLDQSLDAVLRAHRIVHDLDFYVLANGQENLKGKDRFGASFSMEEHQEAEEIQAWINRHINHKL